MQIECVTCKCRVFYLMAQEDGSIEAYCSMHNHKRILVNIPELIEHALKGIHEDERASGSSSYTTRISTIEVVGIPADDPTGTDNFDEQDR